MLKKNWSDARRWCRSKKGDLASINDLEEQREIDALLISQLRSETFWIGANDIKQEGRFEWSDGSRFRYANWYRGEPNNKGAKGAENCVQIMRGYHGRKWNDLECSSKIAFVCKVPN